MAQHYFDSDPGSASRPSTADLVLPDLYLRLYTDRGVFSPEKIDLGTRVLLESVPEPPPTGRLLDLGCGYGPIALTMASRAPTAQVLGVDVNTRAVDLARRNAAEHGLDNAHFAVVDTEGGPAVEQGTNLKEHSLPNGIDLQGPFDAIWSNPPIRVGKSVLHAMLRTWLHRLSPEGTAHLVVQKHLGADSLHAWLDKQDMPTERMASRAGFRVLSVRRPDRW